MTGIDIRGSREVSLGMGVVKYQNRLDKRSPTVCAAFTPHAHLICACVHAHVLYTCLCICLHTCLCTCLYKCLFLCAQDSAPTQLLLQESVGGLFVVAITYYSTGVSVIAIIYYSMHIYTCVYVHTCMSVHMTIQTSVCMSRRIIIQTAHKCICSRP